MDLERIRSVVAEARADGRSALLEPEGLQILIALGVDVPRHIFLQAAAEPRGSDLASLRSSRLVVKVVAPGIAHKSELGGVTFVDRDLDALAEALRTMRARFRDADLRGYLIAEYVPYEPAPGAELLFSARWTDDFGPVVSCGLGGLYAEHLAGALRPGLEISVVEVDGITPTRVERALQKLAVVPAMTGQLRGQPPRIELDALATALMRFAELAHAAIPDTLSELEVNPMVVAEGRPVALDVLARCGSPRPRAGRIPPRHKLDRLLQPESIAIVGVSERQNPGRVILRNVLREGFARERLYIVKPGADSIDGVDCVPEMASLPERVDLIVLAVAASEVPALLTEVIEGQRAESVIVIPAGLEEKEGGGELVARIRSTLEESRRSEWGGPVIAGGNSMGIRSRPGQYDTTFIPEYKFGSVPRTPQPIAVISQSGAFIAAKLSKLAVDPLYAVSVGNQMDLTIGDYLTHLKDDPAVEIFAVYVEGFRTLDGARFLEAARGIVSSGRTVLLYRAGRTAAGARATASHTAVIAGDYVVSRELAREAGVVVCDSTADFEDLINLFARLPKRPLARRRLGALSNAGFECVASADHLGELELAELTPATSRDLNDLLRRSELADLVDVSNPLDLTPMADDATFADAAGLIMADENVDLGLIGCVPLTPALQTLPAADHHGEDVHKQSSVAARLARLKRDTAKPWVAVVDAGPAYDPFVTLLERQGIPVYRTAGRALRMLRIYATQISRSSERSLA